MRALMGGERGLVAGSDAWIVKRVNGLMLLRGLRLGENDTV